MKVWIEGKYYDLPPGVSLLPFEGEEAHKARLQAVVKWHEDRAAKAVESKKDPKRKK